MRIIIQKNQNLEPAPAPKKRRAFTAFMLAFCMVFVFVAGGFLGVYLTRKIDKEFYDQMQDELAQIEYFADLSAIMDFAEENFYQDITRDILMEYACRGVIDYLDEYSTLYTKEDLEYIEQSAAISSMYGKIGITVSFLEAGKYCIREIAEGSPAALYNQTASPENRIIPGDYIEYIDGYYVEGSFQDTISALLSGFVGDSLTLDLYHDYNNGRQYKRDIVLTRANFTAKEVFSIMDFDEYIPGMGDLVPDDIGYIRINSFKGTAAEDFAEAIQKFNAAGKTKLVLDLRNNGGGTGNIMCKIASYLMDDPIHSPSQEVVTVHFKNGSTYTERTPYNRYIYTGKTPYKIAVLVNGATASASECVIGAMLSASPAGLTGGSCELFGTSTFGKGIGQFSYQLDSTDPDEQYLIKISVGEYTFRGDVSTYVQGATGFVNSIHNKGFSPKPENTVTTVSHTLLYDEAFEKAVEFLRQQV